MTPQPCMVLAFVLLMAPVYGRVPSSPRAEKAIARVRPRLTRDLDVAGLRYGSPIFIRIFKDSKQLEVWVRSKDRYQLFRTYRICHFSGTLGPKTREGDLQAPEGFYYVTPSRMNPKSQYHLSLNIGYPNRYDREHGRTGSLIMVHGSTVSIGCFAMTDPVIEEIYALADAALRGGQRFFRVHVFPFRMTDENLAKHKRSRWSPFWKNLKEGYDFFEKSGGPPNVLVKNRRYCFEKARD